MATSARAVIKRVVMGAAAALLGVFVASTAVAGDPFAPPVSGGSATTLGGIAASGFVQTGAVDQDVAGLKTFTNDVAVTRDVNATTNSTFTNQNSGATAATSLLVQNDAAGGVELKTFSSGYTPSGLDVPNANMIRSPGTLTLHAFQGGGVIQFGTANVERVRITGTGNFGIGISAPTAKLHLTDTTNTTLTSVRFLSSALTTGAALRVEATNTAQTGNALLVDSTSTAAVTNGLARFNFTGAHTGNGFQINDVTATGTEAAFVANSLTSGKGLDLSTSATAFTGTLLNVSSTGSNAANTGTLLKVSNTGVLSDGTVAMFTNAGTSTSFRVNDDGTDTDSTPFLIDNAGNVGVGTTSPIQPLQVVGNIASTSPVVPFSIGTTVAFTATVPLGIFRCTQRCTITRAWAKALTAGTVGSTSPTLTVTDGVSTCTLTSGSGCNAAALTNEAFSTGGTCTFAAGTVLDVAGTKGDCTVGPSFYNVGVEANNQ